MPKASEPFTPLLCHGNCFTLVIPKDGFRRHSPLPAITPAQLCQSYVLPLPSARGRSVGPRLVAQPDPTTSSQLVVELGQDEGLYGHITLRSTVPRRGVPRRGLCSSPLTAFGTWRGRIFCPLRLPAPFPAADVRAERADRSEAGGKQPVSQCGAAAESTRLHKRCLVFPPRARPLPHR